MLGKLIKYDMKALNRFLILIHGFLLFAALLVRFFLTGRVLVETPKDGTLLGLSFLLFFLIIMGVSFGTFIVITVRFYKNLFSDEGYLTRTLPVTSGHQRPASAVQDDCRQHLGKPRYDSAACVLLYYFCHSVRGGRIQQ